MFFSLSHLFSDSIFAEFIFSLIHAPSVPLVFDSVGYVQDYLEKTILLEQPNYLFGSEYLIEEKLSHAIKHTKRPIFLNDVTDYS